MERRLYEAAMEGSVISLLNLLQEDALILDRFIVGCYTDTPLHIASLLGHVEFVKEILSRKPELARELDSRNLSPLHLATAKGYLDIVKNLLVINPEMCLVRDRDGRNPLHIAAIKGHVSVLRELIGVRPQAARVLMDRRETILHVCMRYNQLEAIKFLVESMGDHEFVNCKDDDGNTILHLAAADKQIEAINFLTTITAIEVNALNANGFTALDILVLSKRDTKDMVIEESLRRAGALSSNDFPFVAHEHEAIKTKSISSNKNNQITMLNPHGKDWKKFLKRQDDWLERKRSALMVVASLIATMAFQAGVNPPGGVWQDNFQGDSTSKPHTAGFSIMADNYPTSYTRLLAYNTTGFVASLSIILLLISGLPLRRRLFMWILMVTMWVAITFMALTYLISISTFTPLHELNAVIEVIRIVILVWVGLMALLLLVHTIRLIVKMIRKIRKFITRGRSGRSSSMVMNDTGF